MIRGLSNEVKKLEHILRTRNSTDLFLSSALQGTLAGLSSRTDLALPLDAFCEMAAEMANKAAEALFVRLNAAIEAEDAAEKDRIAKLKQESGDPMAPEESTGPSSDTGSAQSEEASNAPSGLVDSSGRELKAVPDPEPQDHRSPQE